MGLLVAKFAPHIKVTKGDGSVSKVKESDYYKAAVTDTIAARGDKDFKRTTKGEYINYKPQKPDVPPLLRTKTDNSPAWNLRKNSNEAIDKAKKANKPIPGSVLTEQMQVNRALVDRKARLRDKLFDGSETKKAVLDRLTDPSEAAKARKLVGLAKAAVGGDNASLQELRGYQAELTDLIKASKALAPNFRKTGKDGLLTNKKNPSAFDKRTNILTNVQQRLEALEKGTPVDDVADKVPAIKVKPIPPREEASSLKPKSKPKPSPSPEPKAVPPSSPTPAPAPLRTAANAVEDAARPVISDLIPDPVKYVGSAVGNSADDAVKATKGLLGKGIGAVSKLSPKTLAIGAGLLGTGLAVAGGKVVADSAEKRRLARQSELQNVAYYGQ